MAGAGMGGLSMDELITFQMLRSVKFTNKELTALTGFKNPSLWLNHKINDGFQPILFKAYEERLTVQSPLNNATFNLVERALFTIARCNGGFANTALTEWKTDFISLAKELSSPVIGNKDGSYLIRTTGAIRTTAGTGDIAEIAILDGDGRIGDGGEIIAGAPHSLGLHEVLTKLGLSHCIYSSHSNGATREELAAKGIDSGGMYGADYHKYRAVILARYTPEQLPAVLDYLFTELHSAGVMLAPVTENKTWAQAWYFPRCPDDSRMELFKFYQHEGSALDVDGTTQAWIKKQVPVEIKPPKIAPYKAQLGENIKGWQCPIKAFNATYSVHDVLTRNGYIKKGAKYLHPNSSSKIPGIQVCDNCKDGVIRVFSHSSDVLSDGHAHDAFDIYRLLECGGQY
jgi:hypothetical protein